MVSSDKYRYVFVELPRTGSVAISRELRENYAGRSILHKHATYDEFLKRASSDEKEYFAFGGLRNPLDDAVSLYCKLKTDSHRKYSDLPNASYFTRLVYRFRWRQFQFVHQNEVDFPTFFLRFYRFPYDNWSSLSHPRLNCIVRFENLAEDFSKALMGFGVEQKRPLPVKNKTAGKSMGYWEYYDDAAIARAKWVFGMYMKKWSYEFPAEWGLQNTRPSVLNKALFGFLNLFRRFYWRHLRPAIYAKVERDRSNRENGGFSAP